MLFTRSMGIALVGMLLAAITGTVLMGQAGAAGQTETKVKKVPITRSDVTSGAQMWKDYCAACHGASGNGNGPAAETLKSPPPDLSLMAKQNNGKFPAEHFAVVLKFGSGGHAHGTSDMPIWGPLFNSLEPHNTEGMTQLRIRNLTEYVESLQQK
jgi:mono/diheme cytochrome c family protein